MSGFAATARNLLNPELVFLAGGFERIRVMPLLLWVVYPFAIWSACAGLLINGTAGSKQRAQE